MRSYYTVMMIAFFAAVRTRISQPPTDTKVILGHVATLQCRVSSDPSVPHAVNWFHDNR